MSRSCIAAGQIHLGTSSWLFEGWRGVFYPERLARAGYLSFYASQFDTVEVNTSFYAIPAPATLLSWVESVPEGFTYALKFPRALTHERRLVDGEGLALAFLDVLRSLGSACAPAFLQFPPDFTRRREGRVLASFLDWLASEAAGLRIAVEVRSADLMTPAFAAFLAERKLGLVLADREQGVDLFECWAERVQAGEGPDFALIRWIGDGRSGPDNQLRVHRDAQLALWAQRLEWLAGQGKAVFGYMHNPYEGHSPASVRRLRALLAANVPLWPPNSAQLSLF